MNLTEQIAGLGIEAKAYFDSLTGNVRNQAHAMGTRDTTGKSLREGSIPVHNREATLMALVACQSKLTPTLQDGIDTSVFINQAQKLRDQGDDVGAMRILEGADLDLRNLRQPSDELRKREAKAKEQYTDKRFAAITKLKQDRDWTTEQANNHFNGMAPNGNIKTSHTSLDDQLRQQINRDNQFPQSRPI